MESANIFKIFKINNASDDIQWERRVPAYIRCGDQALCSPSKKQGQNATQEEHNAWKHKFAKA